MRDKVNELKQKIASEAQKIVHEIMPQKVSKPVLALAHGPTLSK